MKWFEGDIPRAIQLTKSNRSVFIVFIAGDDDKSREMESFLHSDDVTGICDQNKCVAVRLLANSNDCKFFSQIYPVVVVPSTFFIADTGIPIEVIGEVRSREDFLTKVTIALETHGRSSVAGPDVASTSAAQATGRPQLPQTSSSSPIEAYSPAESDQVQDVSADDAGAATGSGDDVGSDEKAMKEPSLEEKVEKAKLLVEKKRESKQKQEAEDDRKREVERRTVGQNLQKLKQQQKEMDVLEAKKELKKDREADKLARQRVKDEIERDRVEKAARFNKDKDNRTKAADEEKKKKLLEQQAAQAEQQARRSDTARIQFRMPDGTSVTQQFPATDQFINVHNFITEHVGSPVTLSMTFPRRTFTPEDHTQTLQDLQLAPSAAIMVIPRGVSTSMVRSSSGIFSFSGITRIIFAPVFIVWRIIGSIFGLSGVSSTPAKRSKTPPASSSSSSGARGGERDAGSSYKNPSTGSKQEGAIRRFHNTEDDESDEDRATWNGNSTQQM